MVFIENDDLRLIVLSNFKSFGKKVDQKIQDLRGETHSYVVPIDEVRFNNGEGKIKITETIRNKDVYIISDVGNHHTTYEMFGYENHMGPDEHFMDIKRVISAIRGQASSITVVMPLLYESRQHRRKGRESLDCALAIQELQSLGVKTIITFDVHDPNIQNATPCLSFENFYPTHAILEDFINNENLDFENLLVVSPDTGAMDRAIYYANMLNTDVGMFYKRRDLTKVVNGKNPIVQHEYMGKDVKDKNVIVVDDMIASGSSMLEVAAELKERGAKKVYLVATFALFTSGLEGFDKAYKEGVFDMLYATNLTYTDPKLGKQKWFYGVDCSGFLARIINVLNRHQSISPLLNGKEEILKLITSKMKK
ncbi:MAG: ribose-phosphate pyrophosphokinase [Bacilli bacterium]|nr:ribose-phosphate pyrophosphokinase [Bacilli bacterium]